MVVVGIPQPLDKITNPYSRAVATNFRVVRLWNEIHWEHPQVFQTTARVEYIGTFVTRPWQIMLFFCAYYYSQKVSLLF